MLVPLPPLKMHLYEISRCTENTTSTYWQPVGSNILTSDYNFFFLLLFFLFVYPCFNWWSLGLLPHLGYKYNAEKILVSLFMKCFYFSFVNSYERVLQNQWTDICLTAEDTIKPSSRVALQQHRGPVSHVLTSICCGSFLLQPTRGCRGRSPRHWLPLLWCCASFHVLLLHSYICFCEIAKSSARLKHWMVLLIFGWLVFLYILYASSL